MVELIEYIAKSLVDDPSSVDVIRAILKAVSLKEDVKVNLEIEEY